MSWLTLENYGRGPCFRDFDDDSTLQGSFVGFPEYLGPGWTVPRSSADAVISVQSARGALNITQGRSEEYMDIPLFPIDRVGQVKRRIEADTGIPLGEQRLFFNGRELSDDLTLEDLPPPLLVGDGAILRWFVRGHDPIHLLIQAMNGDQFWLDVNQSDLVIDAKMAIQARLGIEPDQQHLFLGGKDLYDDDVLANCSIQNGFCLHLMVGTAEEISAKPAVADGNNDEDTFLQLEIHDLVKNVFISVVARRGDNVAEVMELFGCEYPYLSLWLGRLDIRGRRKFRDYPLGNGMILHLKEMWKVHIRGFMAPPFTLLVSPTDLVSDVKRMISLRGILRVNDQRLIYAGRQLENEHALQAYGPLAGATLNVVLRLRG
jgi:ubiquitin C